VALPPVEVSLDGQHVPEAGATTSQPRVIDESYEAGSVALTIEGIGGTTAELSLRRNSARLQGKGSAGLKIDGAELAGEKLKVAFPSGSGFVSRQVRISWPKVAGRTVRDAD
jgi:hypothetical protein